MPERKKVYLIDYPNFRTTRHWRDYLAANHDLVTDMYMNPIKAAWADVIFCEWVEGAAQQLSRRTGHFDDVYDHEGMIGPAHAVHSGDWHWPNAKIFLRGIDIDLHMGHFRGVSWENVEAFMYIAPHFRDIIMDGMTYPDHLKIEEVNLSVKMDEWAYRERNLKEVRTRNIAWVNEVWSAKNLPGALYALADLKNTKRVMSNLEGLSDYKLHVVSNGKSNEAWLHRHIKHLVRSLDLTDDVIFYDSVPSIDTFLEDKDFLWQTSMKEGFSLICAEAMAKGIKILMLDWESSRSIWPGEVVCRDPYELARRTLDGHYDSNHYRNIAATHSHDKEIAKLREITGL
jgi:glycosyltransferase involved in cell wall biosynthesis